ncbi:MAG: xanthine dehydrogenase family protein [Melioribacteraceae bacterium]|nr:xanthine dehydrogenase family protein [Melioribacteraceae bacterium]
MKKDFSIVGKEVIRQDGLEKVTGTAMFADDIVLKDILYGVMLRTTVVHAEIKSIDFSEIADNKNLTAIITSEDIPGAKKVGAIKKDQPIFCFDKVRTSGDVLAMLVGNNEKEIKKLLTKIKVEYSELPILSNSSLAMNEDAPVIHEESSNNLICEYPLRKGNVEEGFKNSDYVIERSYSTSYQEHAYIEPEAVIAIPLEGNKGVKIIGSIQNPHTTRSVAASVLGWPLAKVRVEQAELGGSFGGKDDTMNVLAARASIAAVKCNRPVKIRYNREDSILESYKRHPYKMKYKAGFNVDGKIKAMKIDIIADGGAYASMTPFVTWRSVVQATGSYEIENVETNVKGVYTNNPYTGAFRGFGSPQPVFAQESLMDEIAEELKISPFKLREINGYNSGSVTASGQILNSHEVTLKKVLAKASDESGFNDKWEKFSKDRVQKDFIIGSEQREKEFILDKEQFIEPENVWRRGIGLSCSFRGCSLGAEGIDAASVFVSLQNDGSVYLHSGLAENGQGLRTTFSIVVSEVLGIPFEDVFYLGIDTGYVMDSGPTVASRSTIMGGGAVKDATEKIKRNLLDVFIENYNIPQIARVEFTNGMVTYDKYSMSFKDLCKLAYNKGVNISAVGWYAGPNVDWDEEKGQGNAYFTYVYGCQVAEVKVNITTGEVYIENITAVHDPGKVINLLGAKGQVYGGVTQGAGLCLWEELNTIDGKIKHQNFDELLIPTSKDIDNIDVHFVEGEEEYGPWGAKSLGEPTLELTSAAISNAIYNATGVRYRNLPLNLEEIVLNRKLSPASVKRGSA